MSEMEWPSWHGLRMHIKTVHYRSVYRLLNKTSCGQQFTCVWRAGFAGNEETGQGQDEYYRDETQTGHKKKDNERCRYAHAQTMPRRSFHFRHQGTWHLWLVCRHCGDSKDSKCQTAWVWTPHKVFINCGGTTTVSSELLSWWLWSLAWKRFPTAVIEDRASMTTLLHS